MKARKVRGVHGVVVEVADPEREARLWGRVLGLPVLRRRRGEVVLGAVSFFVVLRKVAGEEKVAELHVAAEGVEGGRVEEDDLGGRHVARDVGGVRLVVRELVGAPSRRWIGKKRKERGARREVSKQR
jgi:catechol 2,3-dioxygenase-like lactoylglutathione lyase family enzyme